MITINKFKVTSYAAFRRHHEIETWLWELFYSLANDGKHKAAVEIADLVTYRRRRRHSRYAREVERRGQEE